MEKDIANMTGQAQYQKPKLLKLKKIKLNGDTGKFTITHLDEPKGSDDRFRVEELGDKISVVFLKVRRRLIEPSRDGMVRQTTEHNTPNDVVMLFQEGTNEKDIARELRDKYQNLRTEQIVYVRYKGEICRLHVKGASLGSNQKDDTTTDFYSYISSFTEGEGWHETITDLVAVQEGSERKYYCIDFQRGKTLEPDQLSKVIENITTVHENCSAFDKHYSVETVATATPEHVEEDTRDVPDYPDEEINPEDIPF